MRRYLSLALIGALALLAAASPAGAGAWRAARANRPAPATPAPITITILSPRNGASYQRGARVVARYRCSEGGVTGPVVSCRGTVRRAHPINTRSGGVKLFSVRATDASGNTVTKTVRYDVWSYVNPLQDVAGLSAGRIDMGVDYAGSGPILAIGAGRVQAAGYIPGPVSCWGRTCAPAPGGWVVYRLLYGPFAGKYVYAVENITLRVKVGQFVRAGQIIAVLHPESPNLEIGWAAGREDETLAIARDHQCACFDPGGWSSIEGRNFDAFLIWLGAPPGYLQETPPQSMPRGWPVLPRHTWAR